MSIRSIPSLCVEEDRIAGATSARSLPQVALSELVLVEVEDVDERLRRQQAQRRCGGEVDAGGGSAGIQGRASSRTRCAATALSYAGRTSFDLRLLSSRGTASPESANRRGSTRCGWSRCRRPVDFAVHVDDIAVLEGAHDLADRVGLTDVREEFVAEPFADRRPLTMPAMSTKDTVAGRIRLLPKISARRVSRGRAAGPRRHSARSSRTDSSPRGRCFGQGVEERRFADIGQSDDADGESHEVRSLLSGQVDHQCLLRVQRWGAKAPDPLGLLR